MHFKNISLCFYDWVDQLGSQLSQVTRTWNQHQNILGKGKGKCIYIARFLQYLTLKALRHTGVFDYKNGFSQKT